MGKSTSLYNGVPSCCRLLHVPALALVWKTINMGVCCKPFRFFLVLPAGRPLDDTPPGLG